MAAESAGEWIGMEALMAAPQMPPRPREPGEEPDGEEGGAGASGAAGRRRRAKEAASGRKRCGLPPPPPPQSPGNAASSSRTSGATAATGAHQPRGRKRALPLRLVPDASPPSAPPAPVEHVRIVRRRPKDARAASDLNWEGWLALQRGEAGAGGGGGGIPGGGSGAAASVGPFVPREPLPDKQLMMLREMRATFEGERGEAMLLELAAMIGEADVPLRLYDWFVSRYAARHRMTREVRMPDGTSAVLDIHTAYKSDRWAARKRHWDFFCKRVKLDFRVDGRRHTTSVSQLHAFLFVRRFRLRELLLERREEVERDFEQGRAEAEAAAQRAAERAAREAGLPEGTPVKRKRGRRRKPRPGDPDYEPPPPDLVMLSAVSVQTRISLQDEAEAEQAATTTRICGMEAARERHLHMVLDAAADLDAEREAREARA